MEEEFEKAMKIMFPWWRESIDEAVKKIRSSFSKNIDYDDRYWIYVSFKALLFVYQLQTSNVQETVDYFVWYIQRKLDWKYSYSDCFELIQCMANNDIMLLSSVNSFWIWSFDEAEVWDESWDDLWYSIDNPIKTAWIAYNRRYLDHLFKANMWKITYNRKWSKENPDLWISTALKRLDTWMWRNNPCYRCVDIYEIYDENWNYLTDLYICPYYKSNTTRAPRWFKYTW